MNTIQLLNREIKSNKLMLEIIHLKLPNVLDVIEKNEYINTIEDLQDDIKDYERTIKILEELE